MVRDDVIEYSLQHHNTEEQGAVIRKKIWKVTIILSLITAIEVFVGIVLPKGEDPGMTWTMIKYGYVVLTVIKAAYIVLVFMHLGDENKGLKFMVLVPYIIFILYLVFIVLMEGAYIGHGWNVPIGH